MIQSRKLLSDEVICAGTGKLRCEVSAFQISHELNRWHGILVRMFFIGMVSMISLAPVSCRPLMGFT